MKINEEERLRRWRLILGQDANQACMNLQGDDLQMDRVLEALYNSDRSAGLGSSSPNVNRWLGDIRKYFPKSTVRVMQKDALDRLGLQQLLMEPELLETVEADVHLVANLLSLSRVIPAKTKDTARQVVRKVVDEELGVKLGKPKSKPGDEGIELGLYLYSLCGRMSEAREALRDIPADAWQLLSEDWPQSIQRVLSECEALIKLLGPYRGPTGKSL